MTTGHTVRPARLDDVPAIVAMAHELAEYEKSADQCHLTEEQLAAAMFGADPVMSGHVLVDAYGVPTGMALWFVNFSTWEGTRGMYLEDLYLRPAARGSGSGAALLSALAGVCVERGYRRMEWVMINWNPAAKFYASIGASVVEDWLPYRLSGDALDRLAALESTP